MGNISSVITSKIIFSCIVAITIYVIYPCFAFTVFVWTGESTSVIDIRITNESY